MAAGGLYRLRLHQSLFFKFSGSQETVTILNTVADWMTSIRLPESLSEGFRSNGGIIVGGEESIASILLFMSCGVWIAAAVTVYLNRRIIENSS